MANISAHDEVGRRCTDSERGKTKKRKTKKRGTNQTKEKQNKKKPKNETAEGNPNKTQIHSSEAEVFVALASPDGPETKRLIRFSEQELRYAHERKIISEKVILGLRERREKVHVVIGATKYSGINIATKVKEQKQSSTTEQFFRPLSRYRHNLGCG
jgi:hypothetical protein